MPEALAVPDRYDFRKICPVSFYFETLVRAILQALGYFLSWTPVHWMPWILSDY